MLKAAEELEEAARIAEIARLRKFCPIRNLHLAGKKHPVTGVPFDKEGFPDFSKWVEKEVKIKFTGDRPADFRAAKAKAGFSSTPEGFTWHHHQDGTTMQLVPSDIHY